MPDATATCETPDYRPLGFVANPFPKIDDSSTDPEWLQVVIHAASNAVLSAAGRASSSPTRRPVLISMTEGIPDYYHRLAENDFLGRSAREPDLGMMALNIPLDMMRLGRIRGTLTELAELVAATDLPATVGAFLADMLATPDAESLAVFGVTAEEYDSAARLFAEDPHVAVAKYLGAKPDAVIHTVGEEDGAFHEAYLRTVGQELDPPEEDELPEEDTATDAPPAADERPASGIEAPVELEPSGEPDFSMRVYLLDRLRTELSPVIARALGAYETWGDGIVAQELKVTKAPRKTLSAVLRLMSHRWKRLVVIYDTFDAWPVIDDSSKRDILLALTELRWLIAETGVMAIAIVDGLSPEIDEQFAAAERVDWAMPEITALYGGDVSFDAATVQRWLDVAAIAGVSPLAAEGPELAPLVRASENDVLRFARATQVAFSDAADRAVGSLDGSAIAAGIASIAGSGGA